MASFVVLSPPGGDARDERNRFIKDGFAFWAAIFPFLWALSKRLYVEAIVLLAAQTGLAILASDAGFETPATAATLVLSLLWGLEARNWLANRLIKTGWQQQGVVVARTLGDAEAVFYGSAEPQQTPVPGLGRGGSTAGAKRNELALGLMDFERGRS